MNRRAILLGAGATMIGAGVLGTGGAALRLHRTPRRSPYLSDTHLNDLAKTELSRPRVLFIGNSMVLRNDLPAVLRRLAQAEGIALQTATAAADGARLIETMRIPALAPVLTAGWDVIVMQDFTKTPLRAIDRWASAWAIQQIARQGSPAKILLYPPWPAADSTTVYRDPGRLTVRPQNPADFADRTMAHYTRLGHPVAPVPKAWLKAIEAGETLYDTDGHHPNPRGTEFVADILWSTLRQMI